MELIELDATAQRALELLTNAGMSDGSIYDYTQAYTTILIQALAAYFDIFTQKAYYMLQQKCSIIFCWSNACFWTKEISHNGNGDLSAGVVSF